MNTTKETLNVLFLERKQEGQTIDKIMDEKLEEIDFNGFLEDYYEQNDTKNFTAKLMEEEEKDTKIDNFKYLATKAMDALDANMSEDEKTYFAEFFLTTLQPLFRM